MHSKPPSPRSAVLLALLGAVLLVPRSLAGQALEDNSFLVEEAYNQPTRVMQTIITTELHHGARAYGLGQEYPLGGPTHQLSYTLFAAQDGDLEFGDAEVNYRWQALGGEGATLFASPRLSALIPIGRADRLGGNGGWGVEVALPLSWEAGERLTLNGNVGAAWRPNAENAFGATAATFTPAVGLSAIVFLTPKFNLIAETTWDWEEAVIGDDATERATTQSVALGARMGFDFPGGVQIVPGVAWMPAVDDVPTRSFLYLSIEHGF